MSPTRREILALAACGAALRVANAQTPARIYREYARCLPDHMRDLADRAYRMRNAALAKLTSASAIRARQEWVTETFWKIGSPSNSAGSSTSPSPSCVPTTRLLVSAPVGHETIHSPHETQDDSLMGKLLSNAIPA